MSRFKEAMKTLEGMAQSDNPAADLDTLVKALQAELGVELLVKSEKDCFQDCGDGTCKQEKDGKCCLQGCTCCYCEDGRCCHNSMTKSESCHKSQKDLGADEEALRKAQEDASFEEELIKASDAYADLQKSVEDGTTTTLQELDVLKKSMGAALNLLMTMAGTIGDLRKSQQEDLAGFKDELKKSLTDLGAAPLAPNSGVLGQGEQQNNNGNDDLRKSNSEIQNALIKAVQEDKVAAHWLSDYGTYKSTDRFPPEVKEILGITD